MENIVLDTSAFGQLTDEQFFDFCRQNRDLYIERTAKGQIIIMTPTGGITGNWFADFTIILKIYPG